MPASTLAMPSSSQEVHRVDMDGAEDQGWKWAETIQSRILRHAELCEA